MRAAPGTPRLDHEAAVAPRPRVHDPAEVRGVPGGRLPPSVPVHSNPPRHRASDRLNPFARRSFGHSAPGHARVGTVCDWSRENVDDVLGGTDESTSAADISVERRGVCRDFAHSGVAPATVRAIPASDA